MPRGTAGMVTSLSRKTTGGFNSRTGRMKSYSYYDRMSTEGLKQLYEELQVEKKNAPKRSRKFFEMAAELRMVGTVLSRRK